MANKKIFMLIGSILLGALAGFALLGYVRGVEEEVLDEVTRVPVWIVSDEIAQGTTADTARSSQRITQSEIESQFRPESAITDLSQIEGQIASADLVANQVLVAGHFADPATVNTTYSGQIAEGHVAFSLTINRERAVNGFIEPGDFVDIIVLGDAPAQLGAEDAFESSLAASPYESPARTLFRGVRIESINNDVLGDVQTDPEAPSNEEDAAAANLRITFSVPSGAAQRLLSVSPEDIVLALLPPDWEPEQQENEVLEAIITDEDLPGEDPTLITPYGSDGFVDDLANEAAAGGNDAEAEPETTEDVETLEPAPASEPEVEAEEAPVEEDGETEEDDQ